MIDEHSKKVDLIDQNKIVIQKMSAIKIGEYLDRSVTLQSVKDYDHIDISALHGAVTLIWIGEKGWAKDKFSKLIENLLETEPLGIAVSGFNVEKQFDLLIRIQSFTTPKDHTMTFVYDDKDIEEVLEFFLFSSFPGDKWDDWHTNHIIVIDDESCKAKIIESFKNKWKKN